MSSAIFPSYLKPLTSSYNETAISVLNRTQYEDGYVAQKQKFAKQTVNKTLVCLLKGKENRKKFKSWFKHDTGYGACWFEYYDPDDEVIVQARIPKGEYSIQSIRAAVYRISFTIEVWE